MSFLSSLLHIPFERGERNATYLNNLSPGIAVVHDSQDMLTCILSGRFHPLTPEKA
jgi:hypothetical protein